MALQGLKAVPLLRWNRAAQEWWKALAGGSFHGPDKWRSVSGRVSVQSELDWPGCQHRGGTVPQPGGAAGHMTLPCRAALQEIQRTLKVSESLDETLALSHDHDRNYIAENAEKNSNNLWYVSEVHKVKNYLCLFLNGCSSVSPCTQYCRSVVITASFSINVAISFRMSLGNWKCY